MRYGETSAKFIIQNDTAYVSGLLGKKAHLRLEKIIQQNPNLTTLCLENIPGSIDDDYNIKSCLMVRKHKLNTHLSSQSIIASGGVDFFLSGNKRSVEVGAKLGVHSWTDGTYNGNELTKSDSAHLLFLDLYRTLEIDTSFYWFTLRSAHADSIHWLSWQEMILYGVIQD
jgi:hypothetical protein